MKLILWIIIKIGAIEHFFLFALALKGRVAGGMCSHAARTVKGIEVRFSLTGVWTPEKEVVELAVVQEEVGREFQRRELVCYLERV